MFLQFCKKYSRVDVRGRCLDELHPINITFFCVKKLHCEPTHILTCEAKHNSLISISHSAKRIGLETPKAYQEVLSSKMVSSVRQNLITICGSAINGFENTCWASWKASELARKHVLTQRRLRSRSKRLNMLRKVNQNIFGPKFCFKSCHLECKCKRKFAAIHWLTSSKFFE